MREFGVTIRLMLAFSFFVPLLSGALLAHTEATVAAMLVFGFTSGVFGALSAKESGDRVRGLNEFDMPALIHGAGGATVAALPVGAGFALGILSNRWLF